MLYVVYRFHHVTLYWYIVWYNEVLHDGKMFGLCTHLKKSIINVHLNLQLINVSCRIVSYCVTDQSEAPSQYSDPIVLELLQEVKDSIAMLAFRATQVRLLYASRLAAARTEHTLAASLQQQARLILARAEGIVTQREKAYRVPWQRIGAWRENPTVYRCTGRVRKCDLMSVYAISLFDVSVCMFVMCLYC